MSPEDHLLFNRWVIIPLAALRAIPRGDGAFAALSMAFGLYERFLASKLHKVGNPSDENARWTEASADFDGKVSAAEFKSFWDMYRVGMQHYFHPKHFTKGNDKTRWGWEMSEHESYKAYPILWTKEPNFFIVKINPWAFAEHVIKRWYEHPDLMNELSATTLGNVRTWESVSNTPSYSTNDSSPIAYSTAELHSIHTTQGHPSEMQFRPVNTRRPNGEQKSSTFASLPLVPKSNLETRKRKILQPN